MSETNDTTAQRVKNLDKAIAYNLLKSSKQKIRHGQVILLLIGGLNLLALAFLPELGLSFEVLLTVTYSLFFVGLAFLAPKMPAKAAAIGLGVYLGTVLLSALVDPATLYGGIVLKVIIVAGLAKAYFAGKEAQELQAKLAKLEG